MGRPLLLDLYCGAGGCAVGYHRAGFDVVGVDHVSQPRYPFEFIQADALGVLRMLLAGWSDGPSMPSGERYHLRDFAAIHASPPCQRYSRAAFEARHKEKHPDLLPATRKALEMTDKPWVIENVDGAPVSGFAVKLCGLMFGLKVFRHRWFESSHVLFSPHHPSHKGKVIGKDGMCCVVGHGGGVSRRMRDQMNRLSRHGSGGQQNKVEWEEAMGIDWMTRNQLSQAIPPAYTQYIGEQLLAIVKAR